MPMDKYVLVNRLKEKIARIHVSKRYYLLKELMSLKNLLGIIQYLHGISYLFKPYSFKRYQTNRINENVWL